MIQEHHFKTNRTSRFYVYGEPLDGAELWFVLHGFGQTAEGFISKFKSLDPLKNLVVAPEGLHRFYVDDAHQKVGASWMTKDDRENDISDYLEMLDKIYSIIKKSYKIKFSKFNVIGFSQGTATASRWAISRPGLINNLALCGGEPANEITSEKIKKMCLETKLIFLNGKTDEIFNLKMQQELELKFKTLSKDVKFIYHDGAHRIPVHLIENI